MSMKKGLLGVYAAFGLIAIMDGGNTRRKSYVENEDKPSVRKPLTLDKYNHVGETPKGCKITRDTIIVDKDGHTLTIEVDILHGTEKGRLKKYVKYSNEIYVYVAQTPLQEIIDSGRFFVSNNTLENNTLL